ncbi:DUF1772 domain-containing protein [Chitinophaga agrisoli]|uniref:DUF1772 domain-containing protein n=1 Tax=Chitinophaga agrisoli TaxID=2607653 RepID=A0A5B2VYJ9_9BACT|nr:anthrone oxygenase family protein [Chitinophaga agrisoli]KAA2243257.1 DUF1772 domain-containing protein [Chitinophaga agrisoli]
MTLSNIVLAVTATLMALIAGLFYAWSCSVIPGIGRLPDREYLAAIQAMNRAILNPVFFLSFIGTALLLPCCSYLHYSQPASASFWLLVAATLIYIVGGFGLTMVGNVPLNNGLDAFSINGATPEALAAQRLKFEGPWNSLHTVRTIACIVSLVLVVIACIRKS